MTAMTTRAFKELTADPQGLRLYLQEKTILECTEAICEAMERIGVTKAELARRLGRTKGFITQLLDGRANMTLRTVSDVLGALGYELKVNVGSIGKVRNMKTIFEKNSKKATVIPLGKLAKKQRWVTGKS